MFSEWVKNHDFYLIQDVIRDFHLNDVYNESEIQYKMNRTFIEEKKLKIPWAINTEELKSLEYSLPIKTDTRSLQFEKEGKSVFYEFNSKGQLYSISEKMIYTSENDLYDIYFDILYYQTSKAYDIKSENIGDTVLKLVNQFGELEISRSTPEYDLDILGSINQLIKSDHIFTSDLDFENLIFKNDMIYKQLYIINSVNIEISIQKMDNSRAIIERIFTYKKFDF